MSGAIAAGMPALGTERRPTRHRHFAGDRGRRPTPAAGADERAARRARRSSPARCCSPRTTSRSASQYLHARETLRRLLDLGVLAIVNENDTVADDEIRYGDNDRLAALRRASRAARRVAVATDTGGLFTADPAPRCRRVADRGDRRGRRRHSNRPRAEREPSAAVAGWRASSRPAKIAAWSGVRAVIASAECPRRRRRRARGSRGRYVVRAAPAPARRRASSGLRSRKAPTAASWSTRVPARALVDGGSRCSPRACVQSTARSTSTRRSRSSATTVGLRQGAVRYGASQLRTVAGKRHLRSSARLTARGRAPRRPRCPSVKARSVAAAPRRAA